MNIKFIFSKIIPIIKRLLGIKDISLIRKKFKKSWGKLFYHKKYKYTDIINIMKDLGMKEGSLVCIHASMMEFYNYKDTAKDIIEGVLKVIGPDGTLVMPAMPGKPEIPYDQYIFNPNNTKTVAGYLAETFRKYPGVIRSNNVHHSVCAIGKDAEELVREHTEGTNCWDEKSPWYKLCHKDALIFNLGLPRSYMGTFHHCVEGILYKEHAYWAQFFSYNQKYNYLDTEGNVKSYVNIEGNLIRKTRKSKVTKYFTDKEWKIKKISNLEIKVFYAKSAFNKLLELGRKGVSVYYVPSTKGYTFYNVKRL